MAAHSSYVILSEKLGAPGSERFIKILEAMFTPLESDICRELFEPATSPELSERLGVEQTKMSKMLDSLVDRGALTRGATQFGFHKSVLAFHHESVADTAPHAGPFAIPQNVKDLWADYFRNEWCAEWIIKQEKQQANGGRNLPISPSMTAIEMTPDIDFDDLLPEENFRQKNIDAEKRIIAPCGCRVVWGVCDHPLMTCFATFDRPRGEFYLNQPGRLLKEYTLQESLDIAHEAEQSGLVHWGDCFCCSCCCENLYPLTKFGRFDLMTPNRFAAFSDDDKCVGCEICVQKCPFGAIEMKKTDSGKHKAFVNMDKCKGCGVCIVSCKQNALTYKIVRPPEYITGGRPPVSSTGEKPRQVVPVWGYYELK